MKNQQTSTSKPEQSLSKEDILKICQSDRMLAEQLFCELFIYLNYDESMIETDVQPIVKEKKPSWTENFVYRIEQIFKSRGIVFEIDVSEVCEIIKKSSRKYNLESYLNT